GGAASLNAGPPFGAHLAVVRARGELGAAPVVRARPAGRGLSAAATSGRSTRAAAGGTRSARVRGRRVTVVVRRASTHHHHHPESQEPSQLSHAHLFVVTESRSLQAERVPRREKAAHGR